MSLQTQQQPQTAPRILVPDAPILVLNGRRFFCLTTDGELKVLTDAEAALTIRREMPIVCHAPHIARRLKMERFHAYDVLELFAFTHPGKFSAPTPRGLARSLFLMEPQSAEDQCLALRDIIKHLLVDLSSNMLQEKSDPAAIAAMMGLIGTSNDNEEAGWPWSPVVLAALNRDNPPPTQREIRRALKLWDRLPDWSQHAPPPPPAHHGVSAEEADDRLNKILTHQNRENRPQQHDYTKTVAGSFDPVQHEDETHVVLAEAGTGTGKTLGYLAPATVWAEKNEGTVWVSTYTRNLQKQIDGELTTLYDDAQVKSRKVVTRKGRENYLCLLNTEDAVNSPTIHNNDLNATALGLMLRWAAVTEDGDMGGKDFPGWLPGLMGRSRIASFADRRGECIYAACPHFDKCFVEKSIRKAKRADIVIANHALVMHQTAIGADETLPSRYIFDEGHHLFDAADSAFGADLNGVEAADLRRWILGSETGRKTRARGIKRRLEDLMTEDSDAVRDVEDILNAARCLPGPQWRQRLADKSPKGVYENFLNLCRQQVYARNKEENGFYSLETPLDPPVEGLLEAGYALSLRLKDIQRPMLALVRRLQKRLEDEAETLDTETRERITFITQSLTRRSKNIIGAWIDMLDSLLNKKKEEGEEETIDWLEVARIEGRDFDTGLCRHYIDPAKIFATHLKPYAHGMTVTSASLRDISDTDPEGWQSADMRMGLSVFDADNQSTKKFSIASPFNYAEQTRIIVIKDVNKNNPAEVASAYHALFKAAGGGALGIFTAIQRLKNTHHHLWQKMEESNLPLYAQHVDPLETSTLIDIFREEENACLLGTDATRDGMDVPGEALRLVVYDRVPWPRPDILHKARRKYFGKGYDDMLARARLKQGYGRLIRTAEDKGVFVMLDSGLPTRLTTAFPEGVEIQRIGLKEAIDIIKEFLPQ